MWPWQTPWLSGYLFQYAPSSPLEFCASGTPAYTPPLRSLGTYSSLNLLPFASLTSAYKTHSNFPRHLPRVPRTRPSLPSEPANNTLYFPLWERVKVRLGMTNATIILSRGKHHFCQQPKCRPNPLQHRCKQPLDVDQADGFVFLPLYLGQPYSANLQYPKFPVLLKELALLLSKTAFMYLNQICITI